MTQEALAVAPAANTGDLMSSHGQGHLPETKSSPVRPARTTALPWGRGGERLPGRERRLAGGRRGSRGRESPAWSPATCKCTTWTGCAPQLTQWSVSTTSRVTKRLRHKKRNKGDVAEEADRPTLLGLVHSKSFSFILRGRGNH